MKPTTSPNSTVDVPLAVAQQTLFKDEVLRRGIDQFRRRLCKRLAQSGCRHAGGIAADEGLA